MNNPSPTQTIDLCPLTPDHSLSAAPQTPDAASPEPAAAPEPRDRFAGYFTFPGDFPPGDLHAITHSYWPDAPPRTHPLPPLGGRLCQPQKDQRMLQKTIFSTEN